ncbi:hypothetical protein BPOR_2021g00010 [Botrytis porri]|uniref:Uncharacterized protein n=1 Tax=Botrytis porri TaxID=87229 RepID=A0A4Z1JZK1_9HELO|nr:hypothetical protein BPOR_2021g00010 [Botrytis porri]
MKRITNVNLVDATAHHESNTVDLTSWESDLRPLAMELRISDDPIPGLPHWSLDLKACPSNGEGDYPLQGYPNYIMQRARPPDRPGALAEYCFKDKNGAIVESIEFVEGPQYALVKEISNENLVQTLSLWAVLANCCAGIN